MKKFLTAILVLAVIGLIVFWFVTMPKTIAAEALAGNYTPDLKNGEEMFNAGGCAGCHTTAGQKERLRLGGGMALKSPFGTFHVPNISPDKAARTGPAGRSKRSPLTSAAKSSMMLVRAKLVFLDQ